MLIQLVWKEYSETCLRELRESRICIQMLLERSFGEHSVYKYEKYNKFQDYFKTLYGVDQLGTIHTESYDFDGSDTDLHKKFYADIKINSEFKKLYCDLIQDIHSCFFPDETCLIYQSFPSIRFQFKGAIAVPPHKDSDSIGNHPLGERNFVLPITRMYGTNRIFVESYPDSKEFTGIDLEPGELLYFNGNTCTHYNERNMEETVRISLDFRVITRDDYMTYLSTTPQTTRPTGRRPTKLIVGAYYQVYFPNNRNYDMLRWYRLSTPIPQMKPCIGEDEAKACYDYIKSGGYLTEYKVTRDLEQVLANYIGVKHCLMTTSGTMSIIIALKCIGIGVNDKVVVPSYTMRATINAILHIGAVPVIVDVGPDTYTLTPEIVKPFISTCNAVIHVSLNNRAYEMEKIVTLCDEYKVPLIEDSAQSLGCRYKGQHLGTFGKIGCFSLSSPKIITTGQGGFVVTDDDELALSIQRYRNFGRVKDGIDEFQGCGINTKFTDLQATVGLVQMKSLPDRVVKIRQIYEWYNKYLTSDLLVRPSHSEWIPWFVDIMLPPEVNRDEFIGFLRRHDVTVRKTYPVTDDSKVSRDISLRGIYLPSFTELREDDVCFISSLIDIYIGYQ